MKIFDYNNIMLIPSRCIVNSRAECDTSVVLGKKTFKLPIVPANMTTIVDEKLCIWLAQNDYFYVMHRFNFDNFEFVKKMKDLNLFSSISVGVKKEDEELILKFKEHNLSPDYITIDIAHGHSDSVRNMIKLIKKNLNSFVIAGNIATPDAVRDLERWGADATKVGVGPGRVCITKLKTGYGTGGWQLSALNWCSKAATKPLIADGGIREHGDIAKSIRFGATIVMIGSVLAGHEESPGNIIEIDGKKYKEYFGSASEYNKGEYKNVEGKKIIVDLKGSIKDKYREITEDLQSSISYAGGDSLNAIKKSDYAIIYDNSVK